MKKPISVLTFCSILLGACASAPQSDAGEKPLIDFASIASQIEIRYEALPEAEKVPEPVVTVADAGR